MATSISVLAFLLLLISTVTSDARQQSQWEQASLNTITTRHHEKQEGLLDLAEFSYSALPGGGWCGDSLYLLVLVQSQPEHFKERQLIRRTWGSVGSVAGRRVKLVFLLGKYSNSPHSRQRPQRWHKKARFSENKISIKSRSLNRNGFFKSNRYHSEKYKTDAIDKLVLLESDLNADIVQGNFVDHSHNLTYKHVMGYKWVTEFCSDKPRFVLKTDDNVFVETYHLFNFLTALYGDHPAPSLVCDVVPAGPGAATSDTHLLTPKYCSGSAYLITPSLIPKFLRATEEVSPISLDDVYMTGVVREHLGISPFYLNQRYTYELERPVKWVLSKKNQPLPFIFVVSNSKDSRWPEIVKKLWRKSELVQHQQHQQFIK